MVTQNKKPTTHAGHIEVAVARLLDYRKNIIVPNVSSGFFRFHEADLVVVDSSNRLTEVEIKVSISDLKADFKKEKFKRPNKNVSRLIYAIPEKLLEKAEPLIPPKYGIIVVSEYSPREGVIYRNARWHRLVKHDKTIDKLSDSQIRNLIRLGCMRIWSLKIHNNH